MTDLESFANMEESSDRVYRRFSGFGYGHRATYVCTVCGRVAFPTTQKNLRCNRCNAPLVESLEKVVNLQGEIKRCKYDKEIVTKIRTEIKMVRSMKKEHAELLLSARMKVQKKISYTVTKKVMRRKNTVYLYNVNIKPNKQYPNGFKGNMKVPHDKMEAFQEKCEKLKIPYYLVSSLREWEASEEMRKAMIEVKKG